MVRAVGGKGERGAWCAASEASPRDRHETAVGPGDSDEGPVRLDLAQVVYVRAESEELRVGFGA